MTNGLSSLAVLVVMLGPAASGDGPFPGRAGSYQLSVTSVEGTQWEDELSNLWCFERGGAVCMTITLGATGAPNPGTWKQDGTAICVELNNSYVVHRGEIRGNRIIGEAMNFKGKRWAWNVKRDGPIRDTQK